MLEQVLFVFTFTILFYFTIDFFLFNKNVDIKFISFFLA
jgi:hypothetical protein